MNISIFRSILIGLLFGLLVFLAPKLFLMLLIIGAIFKLSGRGRWKREQWKTHRMAYADKIRNMGDEDYENFKNNMGNQQCYKHQ